MALKTQQGIVIYSDYILNGEKLQALIQNITNECISIYIPIENIKIDAGIELFINFWDDTATYEFKSRALTTKLEHASNLNITRPSTLTKIFNRIHPRIKVNLQGAIYDYEGINRFSCNIIDLSAGGSLITAPIEKKIGEVIKLTFILPNGDQFEDVNVKIMWKKKGQDVLFNYGLEFQHLSEIRRKKIIYYINQELAKKQLNK